MNWIKIEDRLPPVDTNVILFDGKEVFCGNFSYGKNNQIYWGNQGCDGMCYGGYEKNPITHWMPLPIPPQEE